MFLMRFNQVLVRFNQILVGFNWENFSVWPNYWQTEKSRDKPRLSQLAQYAFKGIVRYFHQKSRKEFFFVNAIYQAWNFTSALPFYEKMDRIH